MDDVLAEVYKTLWFPVGRSGSAKAPDLLTGELPR